MTRLSFAVSDDAGDIVWESESERSTVEVMKKVETTGEVEEAMEKFNLWEESKLLMSIALPAVAVQFSVFFIVPQTASIVGRTLGTDELAGFSLGSLVGNLTCLSVMVGALTAADTLMPRAYGTGNYPEMGRLAIRGFVMCSLLLVVPVIPLCTVMETIFDALGQDEYASHLASRWIKIYLVGVPSMLLFRVVQSFLNAQHKVWPLVYASVFTCFVVHPFVLKACVGRYGIDGSSLALDITQWTTFVLLVLYLWINPVHVKESWPPLTFEFFMESIAPGPMMEFLSLSLGGVLALSEWWFWETVCFIVGSFGVIPLCVHTIAYNLVPLLFMIPLGIMIGLQVRIGHVIGYDVPKAKLLAAWCMLFTTILGAIVALLLYHFRVEIATMFTKDEEVIQGCQDIWPKLCYYIFLLYIFGINSAILRALGMQWRMAAIIGGCLWAATLPTLFIVAVHRGGGIDAVWSILPFFYTVMQVILAWSYLSKDWNKISHDIREQAIHAVEDVPAQDSDVADESTQLLR